MKTNCLLASLAVAGLSASASVPVVSNVSTSQDASRRVTVTYTLSEEPGIITLTAQTNRGDNVWIDIGDENLTYVSGDVNKIVPVGDHSLTWLPHKSWPDQHITDGKIRIGVKAWAKSAPPDYMVVSLVSSNAVSFYASAKAIPGGVQDDKYKTEYMVMRKCPAANVTWRMGSPTTETGRNSDNEEAHEVTLPEDFYIGVYPVTQRQYELVKGGRPSAFKLDSDYATRPVENVPFDTFRGKAGDGYDWPNDKHKVLADSFIGKLRTRSGMEGFDLPTEAQWEFACRAGCGSAIYNGTEYATVVEKSKFADPVGRYGWNGGYSDPANYKTDNKDKCDATYGTPKVGSYDANDWGIYDMLGGVNEFCLDWGNNSLIGVDPTTGPTEGENGKRVIRGGGWNSPASKQIRSAYRSRHAPADYSDSDGYRMCCPAEL